MHSLDLTLSELLQLAPIEPEWFGQDLPHDAQIPGISTDSRNTKPGELFFALRGDRFDGHDFVEKAFQAGAMAAVVEKSWYAEKKPHGNFIAVKDTLQAYQEFARYYLKKFEIEKIALTGSAGKTTTKEAIYHLLSQKYRVLRNIKSYNNHVGVPATIFLLRPEHEILLTEMGANHFGELTRLSYLVEPSVCVVTNIGFAHLEFFGSLDGVLKAKMEIFAHARDDAVAIYNYDDPRLAGYDYPTRQSLSFGLHPQADVVGTIEDCDEFGRYTFSYLGHAFKLKTPGRHNVANALAAIAVGVHFGLTIEQMQAGLELFEPVEQRMRIIAVNGMKVIDDSYNSNPDSCRAAFATLADIKTSQGGRRIVVLGDMLELGAFSQQEHARLAEEVVEYGFEALFLYGPETKSTAQRASELGIGNVWHFDNKEDLHNELLRFIHPNDLVLVKGSRGMQMETVVEAIKSGK